MAKPNEFNWTTQERIKSHEDYLRGSRSSLAASLNWETAEISTPCAEEHPATPDVEFPSTLVDDPQDHDAAVDHSDDTKPHDTSASFSFATNWDALLDTAGVPTDGTPPDPLAAQQQQDALEEQAARQAQMMGRDTGSPAMPSAPMAPPSPQAHDKAKQRERAGRGVEGSGDEDPTMTGPTNPMDPGSKYDWDSFSTTPRI